MIARLVHGLYDIIDTIGNERPSIARDPVVVDDMKLELDGVPLVPRCRVSCVHLGDVVAQNILPQTASWQGCHLDVPVKHATSSMLALFHEVMVPAPCESTPQMGPMARSLVPRPS